MNQSASGYYFPIFSSSGRWVLCAACLHWPVEAVLVSPNHAHPQRSCQDSFDTDSCPGVPTPVRGKTKEGEYESENTSIHPRLRQRSERGYLRIQLNGLFNFCPCNSRREGATRREIASPFFRPLASAATEQLMEPLLSSSIQNPTVAFPRGGVGAMCVRPVDF